MIRYELGKNSAASFLKISIPSNLAKPKPISLAEVVPPVPARKSRHQKSTRIPPPVPSSPLGYLESDIPRVGYPKREANPPGVASPWVMSVSPKCGQRQDVFQAERSVSFDSGVMADHHGNVAVGMASDRLYGYHGCDGYRGDAPSGRVPMTSPQLSKNRRAYQGQSQSRLQTNAEQGWTYGVLETPAQEQVAKVTKKLSNSCRVDVMPHLRRHNNDVVRQTGGISGVDLVQNGGMVTHANNYVMSTGTTIPEDDEAEVEPPPPPPDVAQNDLMLRLGMLLGRKPASQDSQQLTRLSSTGLSQASCSGNQTEDTAYASVSSLGSEDTSQEKVLSDTSPLSTMTGR
ncbi:hypothetical protein LSH36_284g02014 [Paralvinella palmiformis]|uniref:Uncharacterized protein n=1 Tax=Paralvinella palmiformis TaxID=53620 RepID=A0AAD9JKD4_9ANNE|nr:hypothetical protein LSH36_284g02014 [Paralvinella palmiformis]